MMALFKPKPPVEIYEFDWLFVCLAWLHRGLSRTVTPGYTPMLARPDTPSIAASNNAEELFAAVKTIAGIGNWECELRQGEAPPRKA